MLFYKGVVSLCVITLLSTKMLFSQCQGHWEFGQNCTPLMLGHPCKVDSTHSKCYSCCKGKGLVEPLSSYGQITIDNFKYKQYITPEHVGHHGYVLHDNNVCKFVIACHLQQTPRPKLWIGFAKTQALLKQKWSATLSMSDVMVLLVHFI